MKNGTKEMKNVTKRRRIEKSKEGFDFVGWLTSNDKKSRNTLKAPPRNK
jgi:hypothetical protein